MAETNTIKFDPTNAVTIEKNAPAIAKTTGEDSDGSRWHELRNSYITKKPVAGILSSIERMRISENETIPVAIVDYYGYRIVIPISEMNIIIQGKREENSVRAQKIVSNMLGAEIDFIIIEMDESAHSVIASRKQAMEKKINDFYITKSASGSPVIKEGTQAQARVVAVADAVLRLEVFGAECFVRVLDMDRAWIPDARDKYHVGDRVWVRVTKVVIPEDGNIVIEVEGKSLQPQEKRTCDKGGKYIGTVTDVRKGVYFLRLKVGVNAIVHSYEGIHPLPKKWDEVAFVCTRMDKDTDVAIGIITRMIRRADN